MSHKKITNFKDRQAVENPEKVLGFLQEIIENPPKNARKLENRKNSFAEKNGIPTLKNRDLVVIAQKQNIILPPELSRLLQKRAVRTISGVSPIGILTKPYDCPGKCIYCPTEERMPKSYMSNQPAAARAVRNKFHPYKQVKNRIAALEDSGHPVSKLEIIVMGGTWSNLPHKYQNWYVREVFRAANGGLIYNGELIINNSQAEKNVEVSIHGTQNLEQGRDKSRSLPKNSLEILQKTNETSEKRIIGLTLETRPDWINESELIRMRKYGCTRIEIGVQTLDDEVQKLTKRGHFRRHVIKAMKLMKDFGFKVCFHLMPGLPGSNPEKDLKWFKEVFEDSDFRPDFIKIYPCVVLETAELKGWWDKGQYEPYDDKTLIRLLTQFQAVVPEWCRIMRLMRDIPLTNIIDGAKFSNLRQILESQPEKLKEVVGEKFFLEQKLDNPKNRMFRDIRAREIGFADNVGAYCNTPLLKRRDYDASEGKEIFLSFESEDEKHLFALLRLRKPSGQKFSQFGSVLHNAALIREVHSYGSEISVGEGVGIGQHRGLGKKLIEEAEGIAKEEWGLKKMTIIAGVGTREYYRKWGYEEKCTYMTKKL